MHGGGTDGVGISMGGKVGMGAAGVGDGARA